MKNILIKTNKLWIAGIMFLLSAFAFPGLMANAAVTAADVTPSYKNEYIKVKKNSSATLYFAFGKAGQEPKNYVPVLSAASITEEGVDYFLIDLSAYTFKADTSLYLKYDLSDTAISVTVPAQKELKSVYCGTEQTEGALAAFKSVVTSAGSETGYLAFTLGGTDVAAAKLNKITWCAGNSGNYRNLSELNLDMYFTSGATLYFRYCDDEAPYSKIAKIKVKKIAKAPSVKLDGNKLTIGLKTGMEYRVNQTGAGFSQWYTVPENTSSMSLADLQGLNGNGLYTKIANAVVEVRVKATANSHCSYSSQVVIQAATEPVSGSEGIVVTQVSDSNIQKGLNVKNNSQEDYQFALVEKNAWETTSVRGLIETIDGNAKKGAAGNVSWKSVKAGKSAKIAYKDFKDIDYVILIRKASVADDKKTEENEFRIASVIRPYGGMKATPSMGSGVFTVAAGGTTKTITFDVEDGYDLYTAVGNDIFAKNEAKSVVITATAGTTVIVKAYMKCADDQTETQTYTYRFVTTGELNDYKAAWGYNYLKKMDKDAGNENLQIMYQRVYLAATQYNSSIDISDLNLTSAANLQTVIESVKSDNPVLIQLGHGAGYTILGDKIMQINLRLANQTTCDQLLAECNANVEKIQAEINRLYPGGATNVQKVKVAHDFIVQHKQYKDSDYAQTMAGALSNQYTPVCMSYALAIKYCCDKMGIQCEIVYGNAGGAHAWNIINYDTPVDYAKLLAGEVTADPGNWYEMDVTWDDPTGLNDTTYVGYTYFNVTTDKMKQSRKREYNYYPAYPVDNCTGTALSYDNVKNSFSTTQYSWIQQ